jgi:trans-aconitate methyltransferase
MERSKPEKEPTLALWDEYYQRKHQLPEPEKVETFLKNIPKHAHILDVGSGNGRWAAAFMRDRPDLTIDLIDESPPSPNIIPDNWCGDIMVNNFKNYLPNKQYDAMWAYHSLFFMPPTETRNCFHNLVSRLKSGGKISFTMRESGFAASLHRYYGLKQDDIFQMLEKENLDVLSIERVKNSEFGHSKKNRTDVFLVEATKK